jgi:polyvinyl alcohol dehydrogenase (cytochrome)
LAPTLAAKWVFTTAADVSATPTVAGGAIYFPDWAGNLYSVKAVDGSMLWSRQISSYDDFPGAVARVSPAVHGQDIIIGDIESGSKTHNGANIMAISRATGSLRWITKVDAHAAPIIKGSSVVMEDER